MINIAVADVNQTYCQGLKTMLEQVEDFNVIVLQPEQLFLEPAKTQLVNILMVDDDLYHAWLNRAGAGEIPLLSMKTIVLTMDRDELFCPTPGLELIYKGSGKREFEDRIRRLAYM